MPVTAKLHYFRIAPRKARLVADLVRGKSVEEAKVILNFTNKKTSVPLLKLLNSVVANAKNNFGLDEKNLFLSEVFVDEGPKYKRWRARARGQAYQIQKKTSHITIILKEIGEEAKGVTKVKETVKELHSLRSLSERRTKVRRSSPAEALRSKAKHEKRAKPSSPASVKASAKEEKIEKVKELERKEVVKEKTEIKKPKFRPEEKALGPKIKRGGIKIFRRKAF